MPARRELTMRQLRQMLRLAREGVSAREIGRTLGVARSHRPGQPQAGRGGWPAVALAGRDHRSRSRAAPVCASGRAAGLAPAGRAGLGLACARAEAARRQSDGAVGGVPGRPPGRVRLQPVLRPVPRVRAASLAGDAPAPCGRRQGVRRLLGQEGAHRRPRDRGGARGRDLRRRARRLQPHLRRGDLDPDLARLDRRARAPVPLPGRRSASGRSRQSEERGPQGLVLRPRDQPQLRHDGGPLRRRRPAGPPAQAARQGQGRGGGPLRPDLHPRPAAPADVLLARRVQRRDRDRGGAHQRPSDAPPRRQPARALREHRAAGAPAVAGRGLRVCRVAPGPGQPRLSRRGRGLPLLGAARADPRSRSTCA